MAIDSDDPIIKFLNSFGRMEDDLHLPNGFLMSLRREDDWSFVIKVHALIEAAVTHLLVAAIKDQRLVSVFQMLELSNSRTGKAAFLDALELIDSPQKRFIRKLSELRNSLVHDVRNVSFSFGEHIASLDCNQKKQWKIAFGYYGEWQTGDEVRESWFEQSLTDPKFTIWWGMVMVIATAYSFSIKTRIELDEARIASEKARLLDEFLQKNNPEEDQSDG